MKRNDYYLYIVPQTGEVYKVRDFHEGLEKQLCQKYGRIFAISGYSRTAKILTLVDDCFELTTAYSDKELRLDRDLVIDERLMEVRPESIAVTEEDIEEGIRCSNLK